MNTPSEKWSDLLTRIASAIVMVVIGIVGMWNGGDVFHLLVAVVSGLLVWELVGMVRPVRRTLQLVLGLIAAISAFLGIWVSLPWGLLFLIVPAIVGFFVLREFRLAYVCFTLMIMLGGYALMYIRDGVGFGWLLWLVAVVVITDVFGYFAGKMFGGPKFWPAVSPKKTWSGTAAGWVGAGLVGLLFSINTGLVLQLVVFSVALSMASQAGDIAESALKRRMGFKDSSKLIPGHGGLFDRFDGMLGAAVFYLLVSQTTGFPAGPL